MECQHKCECENGGVCDRQSGKCSCPAGWMGTRCETGKKTSYGDLIIMLAEKNDYKEDDMYIYSHSVCFDQHVLKVYMGQAVRSIAGVIITPHVITSLAPACVRQAGEARTARKVIFPNVCQLPPADRPTVTHLCSFSLFTRFIWEAMCSAMPLSSRHFL